MVGEEFGWTPLDGLTIVCILIEVGVILMVPGFLLSLALFPKRHALSMSERVPLSFGLGLITPLLLSILNRLFEVRVTTLTSLALFLAVSVIGIGVYLKRGGDPNLYAWYRAEKEE